MKIEKYQCPPSRPADATYPDFKFDNLAADCKDLATVATSELFFSTEIQRQMYSMVIQRQRKQQTSGKNKYTTKKVFQYFDGNVIACKSIKFNVICFFFFHFQS